MIIGRRIRELREEKNMSMEALAKAIGVDRRSIGFWESETNEPKASYIKELAIFFGVSADYLLGIKDY